MKYILFISLLFSTLQSLGQDEDVVLQGQTMPAFSITSIDGQTIDSASLKNKVVLITFFATWCPACMVELPELQKKVWKKYKDDPNFILLVIGRGHTDEELKAFQKKRKFNLPFYADQDKHIYELFANKYIPRNYLVDKNGKAVFLSQGFEENEFNEMVDKIDELLK